MEKNHNKEEQNSLLFEQIFMKPSDETRQGIFIAIDVNNELVAASCLNCSGGCHSGICRG